MLTLPALETLTWEVTGSTVIITLNRPGVLNAMNQRLFDDLELAFLAISNDPATRVVLITGAGERAFAAGADINELVELKLASGERKSLRGQSVFHQIETCSKPVIALVNGFALGGGCELALACHLRIASEKARFGQPEVKLGLIAGYGGTQRLPRLIGRSAALKLLLTGEIIGAGEALNLGLVNEVVAPDKLLSRGHELAQSIAANAPLAITGCLEAVRRGEYLPIDAALRVEADYFGQLCATSDKNEGTQAFLAKRPPVWTGR